MSHATRTDVLFCFVCVIVDLSFDRLALWGVRYWEQNVLEFCPISCRNIPLDWVGLNVAVLGHKDNHAGILMLEFLSAISEGG